MQIVFQDPENVFPKPLSGFNSNDSTVLGDVFMYITKNYGYTITPHIDEFYQEDDNDHILTPKYFDIQNKSEKTDLQTVDIHIIRNAIETCPKQNLIDKDIIIFRQLILGLKRLYTA